MRNYSYSVAVKCCLGFRCISGVQCMQLCYGMNINNEHEQQSVSSHTKHYLLSFRYSILNQVHY